MHVIEGKLSRLRAVRKSIRTRGDAQRRVHRSGRGERNWFLSTRRRKWKLKTQTVAAKPEHKSAFQVFLNTRPQKANRRRSRAGYGVCSFLRDGGLTTGFRRYRALRWWTGGADPAKNTSHPGRQQVQRALRKWAAFTLWRGRLCCNSGGSWQGYTLQMLRRDIFLILPSATRRPRARPTQRELPATRPLFLQPAPGRIWRCQPPLRATGPREFTPMDGIESTAVHGSGVAAVIIPPREVRELETHLAASWRLVDWNTSPCRRFSRWHKGISLSGRATQNN